MTKFHILSDLHLEMGDYTPPLSLDCDFVILAGDIALREDAFPWIKRNFPDLPSIYVNGNHEYYKNYFVATIAAHRDKATQYPHILFLENEIQHYPDKSLTVYGGTMWTDFMLDSTLRHSMTVAQGGMNDYHLVRVLTEEHESRKLNPEDTLAQHKLFLKGLEEAAKNRLDKFVIVSHHAPSPKSIHPDYEGDRLNAAYASDLTHLIREYQPDLWVHGHMHNSQDYYIGKTRVVCNPRGYPRGHNANPKFSPHLVVEI